MKELDDDDNKSPPDRNEKKKSLGLSVETVATPERRRHQIDVERNAAIADPPSRRCRREDQHRNPSEYDGGYEAIVSVDVGTRRGADRRRPPSPQMDAK